VAWLLNWIHFVTTVALFLCLFWYGFLLKRTVEWNQDLEQRLSRVESEMKYIKAQTKDR